MGYWDEVRNETLDENWRRSQRYSGRSNLTSRGRSLVTPFGTVVPSSRREANLAQGSPGASTYGYETPFGYGAGAIDLNRVNRYFPELMEEHAGDVPNDTTAINQFLNQDFGVSRQDRDKDILNELFYGQGAGMRGAMDLAIEWSISNHDKFMMLQHQLVQHGFYSQGEPPKFGLFDDNTGLAITDMFRGKMRQSHQSVDEYLDDSAERWQDETFLQMNNLFREIDKEAAEDLMDLKDQIENMDLSYSVTDSDAVYDMVQDKAVETLGRRLNDSEVEMIRSKFHENERQQFYQSPQYRKYQSLMQQMQEQVTAYNELRDDPLRGTEPHDLETFMAAIRMQESGGNPNARNKYSGAFGLYQFMPKTWANAAKNAGLDPHDHSPENQTAVAKYLMTSYYTMFAGDWRKVAIAWYAGPASDAIDDPTFGTRQEKNGHVSIQGYADQILQRMRNGGQLDVDRSYASADLGSLGGGGNTQMSEEDVSNWWDMVQDSTLALSDAGEIEWSAEGESDPLKIDSVSDLDIQAPQITEFETFDPAAFLKREVREKGGVDADTWRYVQMAQDFHNLLGKR